LWHGSWHLTKNLWKSARNPRPKEWVLLSSEGLIETRWITEDMMTLSLLWLLFWKGTLIPTFMETNRNWVTTQSRVTYALLTSSIQCAESQNMLLLRRLDWTIVKIGTSRPARVKRTVPKPPAVIHFCVENPKSSINRQTAATQTEAYIELPINCMPTCSKKDNWLSTVIHKIRVLHQSVELALTLCKLTL
jgi:hypothetical protein